MESLDEKLLELQDKKVIKNKTRSLLLPVLMAMDKEWKKEINKFYSVAVGIADGKYYPYIDEPSILLLKDIKHSKIDSFNESMEVIKRHSLFIKDYIFADAYNSTLHMLVVRIAPEYETAYKYFLQSKYSMMYSEAQRKRFFTPDKRYVNWKDVKEAREILDQSPIRRTALEKELEVYIPDDAELASKIDYSQEIFNYDENAIFLSQKQKKIEYV